MRFSLLPHLRKQNLNLRCKSGARVVSEQLRFIVRKILRISALPSDVTQTVQRLRMNVLGCAFAERMKFLFRRFQIVDVQRGKPATDRRLVAQRLDF